MFGMQIENQKKTRSLFPLLIHKMDMKLRIFVKDVKITKLAQFGN